MRLTNSRAAGEGVLTLTLLPSFCRIQLYQNAETAQRATTVERRNVVGKSLTSSLVTSII